jgi:hypothetical protein
MADPYVYAKFKLKAVIGGHTFEDIVSMSATFGLNSIPTATLTVAVGHDARSGRSKKATIHTARKSLKPRDKAVVTLTIAPTEGNTSKMEEGTFVIFDGMLAGIGYQRSHNNANFTIQLIHWLDDLNNSSALNGNWFPNAPYSMATNAAFYALELGEGGGAGGDQWSSVPAIDINGDHINKGQIESDLWGNVIKPVFEKIAQYPLPNDKPNDAAIKALDRMPNGAPFNTPLRLDLEGLNANDIELSVRTALTKDSLDSFAYTSFWGKLVGEYAAAFFFAVSPGIEHACVIPFFGGLKFEDGAAGAKTIYGDEYSYANFNASLTQLLESVMVFWPSQSDPMLGTGGETQSIDSFTFPVGEYPKGAAGEDKPGLKLFKDLPPWLANISPWPVYTGPTTGIKGKLPGDCLAPQTGESDPPPNWLPPAQAADEMTDKVAERFAHHWYKTELLGQRYGELSGKLRFDIAPGSIVKIEMPTTEIESDGFMVAAVTQVSYAINAERALAGTSFALSYLRTLEEDNDSLITHSFAPLYKEGTKWHGGPLKKNP